MQSKTVLITGGTGGIGYQTALTLAMMGARVVVSGRNAASGAAAVAALRQASGNEDIAFYEADLATQAGVRGLASAYMQQHEQLDVLINNAGVAAQQRQLTVDGIELNLAVNVVAPYLLTQLLLPALQSSESARVVTLTGGSHPAQIELDNLQAERAFRGLYSYSHAKLVMMALMYEYAQRMLGSSITLNVCYPGQASTNMTQQVTAEMLPGMLRLIWPIFRWVVRPDNGASAKKASQSSVYLASSARIAGMSGIYVDPACKQQPWPAAIHDQHTRQQVWQAVEACIK